MKKFLNLELQKGIKLADNLLKKIIVKLILQLLKVKLQIECLDLNIGIFKRK